MLTGAISTQGFEPVTRRNSQTSSVGAASIRSSLAAANECRVAGRTRPRRFAAATHRDFFCSGILELQTLGTISRCDIYYTPMHVGCPPAGASGPVLRRCAPAVRCAQDDPEKNEAPARRRYHTNSLGRMAAYPKFTPGRKSNLGVSADNEERVGFEPTEPFQVRLLSRQLFVNRLSTAPSLMLFGKLQFASSCEGLERKPLRAIRLFESQTVA